MVDAYLKIPLFINKSPIRLFLFENFSKHSIMFMIFLK